MIISILIEFSRLLLRALRAVGGRGEARKVSQGHLGQWSRARALLVLLLRLRGQVASGRGLGARARQGRAARARAAGEMPPKTEYIQLVSKEGHKFYVDKAVAIEVSQTIRSAWSVGLKEKNSGMMNLPTIPTAVLEKVIQYMYYKVRYTNSTQPIPVSRPAPYGCRVRASPTPRALTPADRPLTARRSPCSACVLARSTAGRTGVHHRA